MTLNFDFLPESARAAGLGALMKGAGLVTRFLPIPQPTLLVGPGASGRLGQAVAGFGHSKILIVTDSVIAKLGLLNDLTDALTAGGTAYAVFDEITPDAPIPLIERGIAFYRENGCDAIVAFGGGSSMDASKAIAVSVTNPGKNLRSLAGYFKGRHNPVPVYAVPTTAGTGSEVTVAAVISDPERHGTRVPRALARRRVQLRGPSTKARDSTTTSGAHVLSTHRPAHVCEVSVVRTALESLSTSLAAISTSCACR